VHDKGIGIAPEVLPRLFEPLQQAKQRLDRPRGGLGLGLVVKGLVELHGGSVAVASEGLGRGATFSVSLPQEVDPAALMATPHLSVPVARCKKILVIEDNRDAADCLCDFLNLLGHETRVAYTGLAGVDLAASFLPAVVISDIGLPGINGYEVARRIRRIDGLQRAMLIALTGYGDSESQELARDAGFDHHLVKPANPLDVQRLLAISPE
jgi:CheY-like chemotaxis protein